jgi:Protein of unknown function (DUF4239)
MDITVLIFLATMATILFATAGVWVGRRILRSLVAEGHHEVLGVLFSAGGTLHAVFLAFLVVAVWQSYDSARINVADEASALTTLYRESTALDPGMGKALRTQIRDYARVVVREEWPVQAENGGTSAKARAAALAMYRLFGREDPAVRQNDATVDGAALAIISQIHSDRNKRTLAAGTSLPSVIWVAAIGVGSLAVLMSFFLFMGQVGPQMIVTSIMACMIALLLCITFILSRPFSGPMALKPDPFSHSLEVFDAVDAAEAAEGGVNASTTQAH